MEKGIRKCRVCGREYEYCKTHRQDTIFRWQDVACCPEHGAIYFQQVAESRGAPTFAGFGEGQPNTGAPAAIYAAEQSTRS